MATQKMKPRGGNSPVIGDNGVSVLPGDNSRYAGILQEIHSWGNVDHADVEALEDRFWQFVKYCETNDVRITNKLAYYGIGITKDDVYNWESGGTRTRAHSDFIKKIKSFCATYREMLGADGRLNPITLVWWQKNYDGFVDKSEVVLTPNNPLGPDVDAAAIADKYQKSLPPVTFSDDTM